VPTYEYRCRSCGQGLEVVQSFTDDALTECPSCTGPLRKVFGSIGITFKGSGFYKTDNRSGSSSSAAKSSESSVESTSSESSSSSSESTSVDSKKSDSKKTGSTSGSSKKSDSSAA
jgi:putative FmdB family regulatory protein